jgi:hypothetical protein
MAQMDISWVLLVAQMKNRSQTSDFLFGKVVLTYLISQLRHQISFEFFSSIFCGFGA